MKPARRQILRICAVLLWSAATAFAQEVDVTALVRAAEEVARLGERASGPAQALTYQHQRLLHLLALGENAPISRQALDANHNNYLRLFETFSEPPPGSNVRISFQKPDPARIAAGVQIGSDVDAIVSNVDPAKPLSARDVARIRGLHHERAAAFARQHGVPAAGAPNADISFLPDPKSMSKTEWRQAVMDAIASGEDAVYQCPLAASAEAKIRAKVPITAAEAGARAREVSRMADESLATADRLDAAARSVQDPIQRQAVEAQAQLQRHYAAKYMKRMVESSEVLARQHGLTPRSTTSQILITAATERTMETARQAAAVGAMSRHFTAQQTQIFVANMAAVAGKTGNAATAAQVKRHIAQALNGLAPAQQGEAIEGLRQTDPGLARDVAQQMRGLPKPKPPFATPPEPSRLAKTTQVLGTAMAVYSGYRSLASVRDAPGPADQFVALDRTDRQRMLEMMTPDERDRLRESIARRSAGPSWSQLVFEGPTQEQREEAGRQIGVVAGGTAGAQVGVWVYGGIGAGVGTAVAGPIGTAVGGVIGAIYGGVVGYYTGSTLAADLGDTRSSWWDHNLPKEEFNRRALAAGVRTADEVRDHLIRSGIPGPLAQQAAEAYRAGSLDAFNHFVHQARLHRDAVARQDALDAENRRLADDHRRGRAFADDAWRRTDRMEREHEERVEASYRDWTRRTADLSDPDRRKAFDVAGLSAEQRSEIERRLGVPARQWRDYADDFSRLTPAQQREIRDQLDPEQREELDRVVASLPPRMRDDRPPRSPERMVPPDAPARTGGAAGALRVIYGQTEVMDFGADFREVNREFLDAVAEGSRDFAQRLAEEARQKAHAAADSLQAAFADNQARLEAQGRALAGMQDRPRPPLDPHNLPVTRGGGITHDTPGPVAEDPDAGFLGSRSPPPAAAPSPGIRYSFQSSPTVRFEPTESPDGRTRVTFTRMGEVRIWAQIEQTQAGVTTRSESRIITCNVVAPDIALQITPADDPAAPEIRARVTTSPAVPANLLTVQWDRPASATRTHLAANGTEIGVRADHEGEIAFHGELRVPVHGDRIGTVSGVQRIRPEVGGHARRQKLIEAGYALEQQGDLAGAVGKYKSAQAVEADPRVGMHIDGLEQRIADMARAQALVNEGYTLEQRNELAAAVDTYEAAQRIVKNDGLTRRIATLRETIARQAEDARHAEEIRRTEAAQRVEAERRATAERNAREQAEREKAAREKAAREQAMREQAERQRLAQEQAARKAEADRRAAAERAAREQAAREQAAREQAAREQAARQQTERDRVAREKAERERRAREQAAAQPQVSGTYVHTLREDGDTWVYELQLRQSGNRISGNLRLRAGRDTFNTPASGTVQGNQIRFDDGATATVSADGRSISVRSDDGGTMVLRKQ